MFIVDDEICGLCAIELQEDLVRSFADAIISYQSIIILILSIRSLLCVHLKLTFILKS